MTAIFRRKPGKEVERTKKAMNVVKRGGMKHELMATHYHKSHEMAGKPLSPDMIMDVIRRVMEAGGDLDYLKGDAAVEDVWQQQEVAIACGGNLSLLLRLLEDLSGKGEWELVKELPGEVHVWREKKWYWRIIWKAFVEKAPEEETDNQGEEAWQPNHGWIENEATDEDEDPWPTTYSSWESSEDNTLADGGGWDIKESGGWENELSWTVDESGDWKIS
ncbi:hypothetical protein FRC02_000375 [Tulasnella sp. 418]|nr:hypothetical protein FRC02_000375 [Tulasnella sp. 418]